MCIEKLKQKCEALFYPENIGLPRTQIFQFSEQCETVYLEDSKSMFT